MGMGDKIKQIKEAESAFEKSLQKARIEAEGLITEGYFRFLEDHQVVRDFAGVGDCCAA